MSNASLIGPHEGRELELMLSGDKPMAFFSCFADDADSIPDPAYVPYIKDGTLLMRELEITMPCATHLPPYRHVLLARPEEAWRLDDAFDILSNHEGDPRRHSDEGHVRMGRLLGYSEEAIAAFTDRCERLREKWANPEKRRAA
ncbi:MAG: hypothetical protein CMM59_03585 [Rhodospirillaceae bacterium]|nr:hypothetical protein [Rhodospirillaceae bacterium]|tara:strand:+ start:504 stop:935 length:432 start_codon:yes stop_codon:yes gene_type:complete